MQGNANVILVNAKGYENKCINDEIFFFKDVAVELFVT